ncbi:hypothetical protein CPC08DRAFT_768947 [Agrocybe pediades]|nr:hypothetical protein CPC08DRAFT_768947 [Agrocybe pediades]
MSEDRQPNINGPNQCGTCFHTLLVQGPARTGRNPGQYYLHCSGPNCGQWHYTWPLGVVPDNAPIPRASKGKKRTVDGLSDGIKLSRTCLHVGNIKGRADPHGSRKKLATLSQANLSQRTTHLALSEATGSSSSSSLLSSSSRAAATGRTKSHDVEFEEYQRYKRDWLKKMTEELDRPYQLLNKVTATRLAQEAQEAQEEKEFEAALAVSLAEPQPFNAVAGSSSQGNVSRAGTMSFPVTRVSSSNMPTVTSQMNADWMRPFEDRNKEPLTLKDKKGDAQDLLRKFRIVFWTKDREEPDIFTVHVCPQWPQWRIRDCSQTVEHLQLDEVDSNTIFYYDPTIFVWVWSDKNEPHLATEKPLLQNNRIYMSRVHKGLKNKVQLASTKGKWRARTSSDEASSTSEVEIVTVVKDLRKHKKTRSVPELPKNTSSSTPCQNPSLQSTQPSGLSLKSPIMLYGGDNSSDPEQLDATPVPATKQCNRSVSVSTTASNACDSQEDDEIQLCTPHIPSPSPIPQFCDDIPSPLTFPPLLPDSNKRWPNNMYVIDIVYGFRRMAELLAQKKGNYEEHFMAVFNQPAPRTSTYHDQVKKWNIAPESLRNQYIEANQSSKGHWSVFAAKVPLSRRVHQQKC